jgi:hypothetical protein
MYAALSPRVYAYLPRRRGRLLQMPVSKALQVEITLDARPI